MSWVSTTELSSLVQVCFVIPHSLWLRLLSELKVLIIYSCCRRLEWTPDIGICSSLNGSQGCPCDGKRPNGVQILCASSTFFHFPFVIKICPGMSLILLILQAGLVHIFDRVVSEIVGKMRDMKVDRAELGCLKAIILFNPGKIDSKLFYFYYECTKICYYLRRCPWTAPSIYGPSRSSPRQSVLNSRRVYATTVSQWAWPVREIAPETPSSTIYWTEVSGTSLLLPTNYWHAHRTLP